MSVKDAHGKAVEHEVIGMNEELHNVREGIELGRSAARKAPGIAGSRSVRHEAQGVLAHILGRLPCPKKTPRKIWNSMLAQYQYRMKIREAENCCRIVSCATKICKTLHKFANCNAIINSYIT